MSSSSHISTQPTASTTNCTNKQDSEIASSNTGNRFLQSIFGAVVFVSSIYLTNYLSNRPPYHPPFQKKCIQLVEQMNKNNFYPDIELWEEIHSEKGSGPLTWQAKHELLILYKKYVLNNYELFSFKTILEEAEFCYKKYKTEAETKEKIGASQAKKPLIGTGLNKPNKSCPDIK